MRNGTGVYLDCFIESLVAESAVLTHVTVLCPVLVLIGVYLHSGGIFFLRGEGGGVLANAHSIGGREGCT